ncbi:MAG: leucine-rich repeat domain-containing protein [Cyanobacteria bacterium J06635_10]
MKFIRLVCIALVVGIVINVTQFIATLRPQNQESIKSFSQSCKQKDSLPKDTKYTVEILLKQAGTQNCTSAEQILNKQGGLTLSGNQISDLSPLKGLTNLMTLILKDNQIRDLSPLKGLTNLISLNLWDNQISDLSPLKGLTNLTSLGLGNNPIKNKICPVKAEYACRF